MAGKVTPGLRRSPGGRSPVVTIRGATPSRKKGQRRPDPSPTPDGRCASPEEDARCTGKRDAGKISQAYQDHRPYLVNLAFRMLGEIWCR